MNLKKIKRITETRIGFVTTGRVYGNIWLVVCHDGLFNFRSVFLRSIYGNFSIINKEVKNLNIKSDLKIFHNMIETILNQ